jgi:hypothetical protein
MNYTIEQLSQVVKESSSIAEALKKINLIPSGGNYKTFKNICNNHNISFDHFTGQGHLKGKTHKWARKITDKDVFCLNSKHNISSVRIKKRLLDTGIERKCYQCNNTTWNSKPIPLELEHKNGNNKDHRKENLTLLCPNCHAQTSTYRGKNINRKF